MRITAPSRVASSEPPTRLPAPAQQPALDGLGPLPEAAWATVSGPERYAPQLRRLADAAVAAGLTPTDLSSPAGPWGKQTGMDHLGDVRGWKPATRALYGKVARYAGIALPQPHTPEPAVRRLDLAWLLRAAPTDVDDLDAIRARAWLAVAVHWPAPLPQWAALRREHVSTTPDGHVAIVAPTAHDAARHRPAGVGDEAARAWLTGTVSVPAAVAWETWDRTRDRDPRLAASPWALAALVPGRLPGSAVGDPLSVRGLQAAFGRHAARAAVVVQLAGRDDLARAYGALSYDTVRRLAQTGGWTADGLQVPRGLVRASRRPATATDPDRPARRGTVREARPSPGTAVGGGSGRASGQGAR